MPLPPLDRRRATALLLGAVATPFGHAQAWPAKPLRIVVNFPPAARPTSWRAPSRRRCKRRSASR
jgi:hypothetical protein